MVNPFSGFRVEGMGSRRWSLRFKAGPASFTQRRKEKHPGHQTYNAGTTDLQAPLLDSELDIYGS